VQKSADKYKRNGEPFGEPNNLSFGLTYFAAIALSVAYTEFEHLV